MQQLLLLKYLIYSNVLYRHKKNKTYFLYPKYWDMQVYYTVPYNCDVC